MNFWGKLLGGFFGYLLAGPFGAVLGVLLGHSFDKGLKSHWAGSYMGFGAGTQSKAQATFFYATFSVMGYIAKSDGRVSEAEIQVAKQVMSRLGLSADMRKQAINFFNEGKSSGFGLDQVIADLRQDCQRQQILLRLFLEFQIQTAYAEGPVGRQKQQLLQYISQHLGFAGLNFDHFERIFSGGGFGGGQTRGNQARPQLEDAYEILEIKSSASNEEIKKQYRRLMSKHHPDKLVAKGLPPEMIKLANEKTGEIKLAYEQIRKARNF